MSVFVVLIFNFYILNSSVLKKLFTCITITLKKLNLQMDKLICKIWNSIYNMNYKLITNGLKSVCVNFVCKFFLNGK